MSAIPASYLAIVTPLIDTARQIVEGGEELLPCAFVGNLATQQTVQVMMKTNSAEEKNETARLIRHVAHLYAADFVFVITEAWALPPERVRHFESILEEYGSIGASPYRIDTVSFSLETCHGVWMAQMPFRAKGASKKKRTFDPPRFGHFTEVQGRLAGLLPVKHAPGEGPGTLH